MIMNQDTTFTVSYVTYDGPNHYAHFFDVAAHDVGAIVTVLARTRGATVYVTPTGLAYPSERRIEESVS